VFAPLLAVLATAVSAWFANRGQITSDEGVVLAWAGKILRGGVFYSDIDAYQFPGSAYLLAGWMWLFGETVNAARWLAVCVFTGLLLGLYWTACALIDRRRAAIFGLGLLSLKFLASPAFTAYMYSDLSLCFASFAIAILVRHSFRGVSIQLVAAGVLVALATAAKQNLGIYLAGASTLLLAFSPWLLGVPYRPFRERSSEVGAFALGFSLAAVPMLGYFAQQGLLSRLVYSGLVRPFVAYLPTSGISFAEPLAWWRLGELRANAGFPFSIGPYWSMLMNGSLPGRSWYPSYWMAGEIFVRALYTSVVCAFLVVFWRWARAFRSGRIVPADRRLFAFACLALAVFLSAFPRADFFHVISVYSVVFLLLFGLRRGVAGDADESGSRSRAPWVSACAVALLLLVTGSLAAAYNAGLTHRMKTQRADLYITPANSWIETVVEFVEESLDSEYDLFVYGHEAYYYFLTGHYSAWPFAQLYPGQVGGEGGMPVVRRLQWKPPRLIIRGLMEWPGMATISSYAGAVDFWVMANYEADQDFFETHPPPSGVKPPWWAISILELHQRR